MMSISEKDQRSEMGWILTGLIVISYFGLQVITMDNN
jgi:hypothetical protein